MYPLFDIHIIYDASLQLITCDYNNKLPVLSYFKNVFDRRNRTWGRFVIRLIPRLKSGQGKNKHEFSPTRLPSGYFASACLPPLPRVFFCVVNIVSPCFSSSRFVIGVDEGGA